jgi:beta-glucanase (GH16 family)
VQDDQDCQNCNAAKAVDGNTTTRWSSAFSDPQWLQIDLGTGALISRVVLNWEAAYGKAYQIQVSNDARTWTTIYTATNGNGGTDDLTVAGTGRYIRLYGTARGTAYGYSLYEFQVYGTAGAGGGDNGTPPAGWQMIWSDEFNSATGTTPDGSKWTPAIGGNGWGNQEREYYTNNNASQDGNGNLVIEARKENPANYQCWYGTCQYTSARLITQNKFEFTHGRVEARIKIPYGQGIWPSIWMMGNDIDSVGWPNNGEIDIFENIGREPATVHGTIHGPNYSGANGIGGAYTLSEGRFADDYHLFAAEWSSNAVDFFVDGNKYFTVTRATVEQHGNWVYDHPFYLLLNVAVGGGWPGDPDGSSTYPQKMSVDYIRVYQQN